MRFLRALLVAIAALGLVSQAGADSPVFQQALLLNGGCFGGAAVDLNLAAGTTCGPAALTVVRNSVAAEDDTAGNWTQFAANVLRRTNKGALIEETRTNSIRNNSMQGAVAGTPGTPPTNWQAPAASGLTIQLVGTGTQNGIDYIDYRFSGTTSGTFGQILFEQNTQIAAVTTQVWSNSFFVALVGGSLTNVTTIGGSLNMRDSGGSNLGSITSVPASFVGSITSALTRFSGAGTLTNGTGTTAFVIPLLGFGWSSGVAIDFTLRIGWPQLELGAFATSPIRTINAAVLRAADVVSFANLPAFGPAFSFYYQANSIQLLATNTAYFLSESLNNRFLYQATATNSLRAYNGTTVLGNVTTTLTAGRMKMMSSFDASGRSIVVNGSAPATDAVVHPAPTVLGIGQSGAGSALQAQYVERVALWTNTRLPSATMQGRTAP